MPGNSSLQVFGSGLIEGLRKFVGVPEADGFVFFTMHKQNGRQTATHLSDWSRRVGVCDAGKHLFGCEISCWVKGHGARQPDETGGEGDGFVDRLQIALIKGQESGDMSTRRMAHQDDGARLLRIVRTIGGDIFMHPAIGSGGIVHEVGEHDLRI